MQAYEQTIGSTCPHLQTAADLLAKICIQLGHFPEAYQVLQEYNSQNRVLISGL